MPVDDLYNGSNWTRNGKGDGIFQLMPAPISVIICHVTLKQHLFDAKDVIVSMKAAVLFWTLGLRIFCI